MSILVCGGAGYIGSHNVRALTDRGEEVIVADNLWTGHRQALDGAVKFYCGDIRDRELLDRIFRENDVEAVIHFAACSLVGESVQNPLKYFDNNQGGMVALLSAMASHGVEMLVFSSTAAVYGEPRQIPIGEEDPTEPANPYGESKLMMERTVKWVSQAHGIRWVSLRYFNVAGAAGDGSIGEDHRPETHLIPLILQVPLGLRESVAVYGGDYPTPDGTCIRDYVHVMDLADGHLKALDYLRARKASRIFNLGSGEGYSVRQIIEAARAVTGHPIPAVTAPRRPGDPARLVASSRRAETELGWKRRYSSMEEIIATAWRWHKNHPQGFGD